MPTKIELLKKFDQQVTLAVAEGNAAGLDVGDMVAVLFSSAVRFSMARELNQLRQLVNKDKSL